MSTRLPYGFLIWLACAIAAIAADGRRLEIMFLGDNGHHKPIERYPHLARALGPHGINFTYVDDLKQLTPANLSRYDAVMIYANHTAIDKPQEQALLAYVANGGGLLPIHSASYCFLNSPAYVELVGAQFQRHGVGIFTTRNAKFKHPITDGYVPFETWDETYVHHRHNDANRIVLQYRDEANKQEPWTWIRSHGKGRVFYTAYGHDKRTWSQTGFHQLVYRGIRWAVGPEAAAAHAALQAPKLKYEDRPTVQNYENRKPKPKYQFPLSPTESAKHTQWPAGFERQLFASDPDIVNPIWIAWDERGRTWIAETVDYPNTVNDDRKGRDRIRILEDTDADGKADKFTTFIDGINIPTSFAFHNDGVIVSAAPNFYFLKDTDGDDKADVKTVISNDWGINDTHAGPSNLQYGFDNWFYGAVGYSGYNTTVEGKRFHMHNGLYRFKPDFSEVEFLSQFNNNTWGLGFSEGFDLFGSTANNNHAVYVGIPKRYYDAVTGISAPQGKKIEEQGRAFPITDKFRQVDVFGGFTAAAGFQLYTARDFPQEYWNRIAFITEPTMHLTAQSILEPDGAGFRERNGFNLTASADEWYSPVHAQVGPDGAVWVLDWYNFIIQHNPTPSVGRGGFHGVNGKGNAHENPLRDKSHGRIWRIFPKGKTLSLGRRISKDKPATLLAALKSDNLFWRLTSQRLIVERGNRDVVPQLVALVRDKSVDAVGINGGAIHALYALSGLNALEGDALAAAKEALSHPSPAVRKAALAVLPRTADSATAIVAARSLFDGDLNVRKDAYLATAEFAPHEGLGEALAQAGSEAVNNDDQWLRDALTIAAFKQDTAFLRGYAMHAPVDPTIGGGDNTKTESANLFRNPDFEKHNGKLPEAWRIRNYSGSATHRIVKDGRNDSWCVEINSTTGSDTSLYQDVELKVGAEYRLSAWVKTENIAPVKEKPGRGVLMNGHVTSLALPAIDGTSTEWKRISRVFKAERKTTSFNLLYGGWGWSTGRALYDDVELVQLTGAPEDKPAIFAAADHLVINGNRNAISDAAAKLPITPQGRLYGLLAHHGSAPTKKTLTKAEKLVAGKKIFSQLCFSCHGLNGEGTVGPNLTDVHFIHGGTRADQDRIIRKGVLEKGMLAWELTLDDPQLDAVSEFVWSLRGTNAPNGKPPEGQPVATPE